MVLKQFLLYVIVILIQAIYYKTKASVCDSELARSEINSTIDTCLKKLNNNNNNIKFTTSRNVLIDYINLTQIIKNNNEFNTCFIKSNKCNFINNCEFSFNFTSNELNSETITVSRLASLLTSLNYNEDSEIIKKLIELNLRENKNIYECKIIFKKPEHKSFSLHGTKTFDSNINLTKFFKI